MVDKKLSMKGFVEEEEDERGEMEKLLEEFEIENEEEEKVELDFLREILKMTNCVFNLNFAPTDE
jgi:hypothetical protein